MARSTWTPPPPPDPSTLTNPPPFAPFPLSHLRAGRIKKHGPFESAIQKAPLPFPVTITKDGIPGDEHAYEPHRHPDKALLHYCTSHYAKWKAEIPASADLFRPGAFGEGVFSDEVSEMNVCIGDRIAIGQVVLEVSEPRAPCFKLNHRFEVRDMARRVQTLFRAGWLYRVVEPGVVYEGDMIRLLERPFPEWTVARVMYYLFLEMDNVDMMREIVALEPLGWEVREKLQSRLKKGETEDQNARMYGDVAMDAWADCRIVEKRTETSRVTAFVLEAVDDIPDPKPVEPGSHVRVKLGGKLVRAYSVVGGTTKRFELGVSLEPESRGGSKYLHEQAKEGDVLTMGQITASFPLVQEADQHIIIAAGIGITAFTTALEYLQKTGQTFHLHYAHAGEMPFKERIKAVGDKATIYDKSHGQRLKVDDIVSRADSRTHIYTCGPQRLMDNVVASAKKYSVPDSNVHLEQFTVTTSGDPFTVDLKESNKTLEIGPTQSLLDVLRSVGMSVDSSCEVGNCGTCKVDVCEGRVEHRGTGLMEDEKKESMLSCVSRGIGRIVLDL